MPWDAVIYVVSDVFFALLLTHITIKYIRPEDGTNEIDKSRIGMPHTLHLSGCFAGNLDILARAQLQVEAKLGCILKIAVRSPQLEVSELISECIN